MIACAVAARWRRDRPRINAKSSSYALIFFSRCLTELPPAEAFEAQLMTKTSTTAQSLFGLSHRKRVLQDNREEDGLIDAPLQSDPRSKLDMVESPQLSEKPEPDNFFSKAWAAQKNLNYKPQQGLAERQHPLGEEYSNFKRKSRSTANFPQTRDPRYPDRVWQYSTDMPPFTQERFIIVSYNVLSSTYAYQHRRDLFAHVPGHLLNWKSRKRKILRELGLYSPDIICLQEVDRFRDLEQVLALKGYVGSYKNVHDGGGPNGCAIFWRKKRFKVLQEESLEFSKMGMNNNVAQLCVLESLVSGAVNNVSNLGCRISGQGQTNALVVGNIRVLNNPKRGDIKLGQCRTFLEQAHALSNLWHGAPVVIAGDFSCTPSSAVYDFLATSELEVSGLDRRYLSGQIQKVLSSASQSLRHSEARIFGGLETGTSNKTLEAERDGKEMLLSSNTSRVRSKLSKNIQSEVSLKERLKKILMPRFASKQNIHATEFARVAAEALGACCHNSLDGSAIVNNSVSTFHDDHCCTDRLNGQNKEQIGDAGLELRLNTVHKHKNEDLVENPLLSRTIEILESSLGPEVSYGEVSSSTISTCEGVGDNDVFPGAADSQNQRITVQAENGSVDELSTHHMRVCTSMCPFSCTPEAGTGEATGPRVLAVRLSNQDSMLDSVHGDGFDACTDSSCNTLVKLSTQSQRIVMEDKTQTSSGVVDVDGAKSLMPFNTLAEMSAQSRQINMEGNANLFGESQASSDVGEVHVNHTGKLEVQFCSSSSSYQSMDHDNNQVSQMSGSASQTNFGKTEHIDTGTITSSKQNHFVNAKVQNRDLEVPNHWAERPLRVNQPPCGSSDQHPLYGCRALELEDGQQVAALTGNSLEQYVKTHAPTASAGTSSSNPEYFSFTHFESSVLQRDSFSNSSNGPNSRGLDSSISDCFSNIGKLVNMSEDVKDDDNEFISKHEWDPEELKRATGDPDSTIVRHKLNLHSVYPEIQSQVGTRDAKGEPIITAYHRQFQGTVDYIWRSDGLKPIKILDTVAMDALLVNKGLPSKVWGSYHLAIACELAFVPSQKELGLNKVEAGT